MRGREIYFGNLTEKEKGYLFGLFEGDGYRVYDLKSRHYHVEFYLNSIKDKQIISFLDKLLKKIGLNVNHYQDKRYNCKRIRVYSKFLFNIIYRGINLKEKSEDFNIGFVSGLIDSEGYVNPRKYTLVIISTNKKILDDCRAFLGSIDISCSISERKKSKKDKVKSYRMYVSVNFKRLNHLSIKAEKLS